MNKYPVPLYFVITYFSEGKNNVKVASVFNLYKGIVLKSNIVFQHKNWIQTNST